MGHMRLGALPATRAWQEVVRLIAEGADVAVIADATQKAAEKAFAWVQKNAGFKEAMYLLTQLGLAGSNADVTAALAKAGISLPDTASVPEVALAIGETLDWRMKAERHRSDLGEMCVRALVSTMAEHLEGRADGLFDATPQDVVAVLKGLSKPKEFGELSRSFFSNLTNETLNYFLSRDLNTHLGEGERFATMNQVAQFEAALKTHCDETSQIAAEFASDWFSKHRHEEGGNISRESAEGFGWYAMQKIRAELATRARKSDGK
jgi:hypothetical protein